MYASAQSNETALWRAVILQAIADATASRSEELAGKINNAALNVIRARDWLLKPNAGFHQVCALADVEPDRVRALAEKKITETEQSTTRKMKPRRPT